MIMRKVVAVLRMTGPLPSRTADPQHFLRLECGHEIIADPAAKRKRCLACEQGLPVIRESERRSEI